MVSNQAVRELALALPGSHEEEHWGEPSFRVGKRIFAVLYGAERRVVLKLPLDCQEMLIGAAPDLYSIGRFSHQGWTHVALKGVSKAEFRQHLETAWREVAPKRVVRAYDEGLGKSGVHG